MARGINGQNIFEDEEDKERYISTMERYKKEHNFELYAYCLMNNHIHLLIKENKIEVAKIMKCIGTSYVYYYNWKYERNGHLFQDRYKSETVEEEPYLLTVYRYILNNPVKAKLCVKAEDYKWSSNKDINKSETSDVGFIFKLFNEDSQKAKEEIIKFINQANDDNCLEYEENYRLTDEKATAIIKKLSKIKNLNDIQKLSYENKKKLIARLKEIDGLSIRQIVRLTMLSKYMVENS